MRIAIRSGRFYFWPIITANTLAMAFGIGADLGRALILSTAVSCLASFGFILNDLWDRNVDRSNKAGHFEEASRVEVFFGIAMSLVFFLTGIALALLLGRSVFILAIGIAFALIAYSVLFRRLLLLPTLLAAMLAASPLWAPLVLWGKTFDQPRWYFVIAIVLMVTARELFMDSRDRRGDAAGGRETLPTVFGARIAKTTAFFLSVTSGIVLAVLIGSAIFSMPLLTAMGAVAVSSVVLYLVLPAAFSILGTENRETIQSYVIRSRVAMALIPVLLLLWRSQ